MNRIKLVAILAVLGIATFVVISSIYTVSEVEQAIITQFGKPIGAPVTTAGLKVKVPFIQDVNLMDKRVLGNPTDMPTKDKLYISVDLFARWRIADPLQYFLRLHDERSAQSRLDDILGSETRNAVAKHGHHDCQSEGFHTGHALPVAIGVVWHRYSRQAEGGTIRKGACQPGHESRDPVAAQSSREQ
jgi:regulator of protease activity HflC (stomatin/prohibitin superfamily)